MLAMACTGNLGGGEGTARRGAIYTGGGACGKRKPSALDGAAIGALKSCAATTRHNFHG